MRTFRRGLLVAVVLGVAAVALPSSVGGATAYVRSYGNSMEPLFHAGDLAVVRSARSYGVGDVVAYRSPQLGRVVLHRIVARDGDAFVFRGDNNGFPDREHLGAEHILGRLALRVPRGGAAVLWLGNPLHAAALAAGASVLPAVLLGRRRRPDRESNRGRSMNANKIVVGCRSAAPWVAVAGALLVLVGVVAFARPATGLVDEPVAFTHTGSFTYSAPASAPLYPDGFTTGDPIFTRLADDVTVGFAYGVDSEAVVALAGTIRVDAVLSGAAGWKRVVPLLEPRPLEPGGTDVEVVLHLPALRALGAEADVITGAAAGGLVVAVTPTVDVDGTVAGRDAAGRFGPALDSPSTGPRCDWRHRRTETPTPSSGRSPAPSPSARHGRPSWPCRCSAARWQWAPPASPASGESSSCWWRSPSPGPAAATATPPLLVRRSGARAPDPRTRTTGPTARMAAGAGQAGRVVARPET